MLGGEAYLPIKAGRVRIVDDCIGVGQQQVTARRNGVSNPASEARKICAIADVVEDLTADDQVESRR